MFVYVKAGEARSGVEWHQNQIQRMACKQTVQRNGQRWICNKANKQQTVAAISDTFHHVLDVGGTFTWKPTEAIGKRC